MQFILPGGLPQHQIEMVVLWNIGGTENSGDEISALYDFLGQVVGEASSE